MVAVASRPKTAVKASPSSTTVGALIDKMWELREKKKKHEDDAAAVSKQMSEVEETLVEAMAAQGVDKSTGKRASASFTYSVTADVQGDEGWAKFYAYIAKHKYFHLLHRRVTDASYKELLISLNGGGDVDIMKAKKQVPGVLPFLKRRVNLRTLSS